MLHTWFAFSICLVLLASAPLLAAADLNVSASTPGDEIKVAGMVPITIAVENKSEEEVTVPLLKLGRGFVEFDVTITPTGENAKPIQYTYTRIPDPTRDETTLTLAPGKSASKVIPLPALLPGTLTVTPKLWNKVQLKTFTIKVTGEGKRAGLKMSTSEGDMTIELWPEDAPNTSSNIFRLATEGFYNDLTFHRIIKGFMVQGGDPDGNGTGGPGFSQPAEFNKRKHVKGVLSMARSQNPDSAGSQFFLMHGTSPHLDGQYTAYGKVVEGLDVVDKLANLPVRPSPMGENSIPVKTPKIKTVSPVAIGE